MSIPSQEFDDRFGPADGAAPGSNLPEFSVSEISQALKRTVEETFSRVRVRGEISGLTRAASGHMYLSLKDDKAVLDGVCWKGTVPRLGLDPEDGLEVIATGRLSTYPGRSRYLIVIDAMEIAGEGALLKLLEDRRKKLLAEGLFDEDRKQPLPYIPDVIGVVTSPTGAVIRDILHRLNDRFPRRVLLWGVNVQGAGAAGQVAGAIEGFNRMKGTPEIPKPDLLIVARGGGSLEDLWTFNEEIVVRAAAGSEIPLISAVGHETDTTLVDFAADLRAPTPTAAAELAVPVMSELRAQVADDGARLARSWARHVSERQTELDGLSRAIANPARVLEGVSQRLDDRVERLRLAGARITTEPAQALIELAGGLTHPRQLMTTKRTELGGLARRRQVALRTALGTRSAALIEVSRLLDSLSYERVLERGFALVSGADGQAITKSDDAAPGSAVSIRFQDGSVGATIEGAAAKPKSKVRKKKPSADDGGQGSLL